MCIFLFLYFGYTNKMSDVHVLYNVYTYIHEYTHVHTCMHAYIHTYIQAHMYTCMHGMYYMYIYSTSVYNIYCVCVCVCVCLDVWLSQNAEQIFEGSPEFEPFEAVSTTRSHGCTCHGQPSGKSYHLNLYSALKGLYLKAFDFITRNTVPRQYFRNVPVSLF